MAKKGAKISKVVVHHPIPQNVEAFDKKAAKSVAKVLCTKYPPKIIDEILKKLKKTKNIIKYNYF